MNKQIRETFYVQDHELSDGSTVFDVCYMDKTVINATSEKEAYELVNAFNTAITKILA